MRGSVRRRGNPGTWEYRLELGLQPGQRCMDCGRRHWLDGRPLDVCSACGGTLVGVTERRQRTQGGFRTRKEAQAGLDKAKVAFATGDYVEPSKLTLAQYLTDLWLPGIEANVRPSTYRAYRQHVELHIIPHLGAIPLQKLSGDAISGAYATLLRDGRRGGGALSSRTVRHVHAVLHHALKDAVRRHRLTRNPADTVDPPSVRGPAATEMQTWSAEQAKAFLEATEDTRLGALWRILLMTGLRRGEACGLRWDDVDLEAGRLSIRRALVPVGKVVLVSEPKTARGRRVVPVDATSVNVLKAQAERQLEEQDHWGDAWSDTGLVFTQENGEALHPDWVSKVFRATVKVAKLPQIRLHDLRHTHATLALRAGVHPKVVSERLGHATVAITLDTYSHAIPAMQEEAAERVAALVA